LAIPTYCFYRCPNIKEITIPSNITSIGSYAFAYIDNLEKINYYPENLSFSTSEIFYNSGSASEKLECYIGKFKNFPSLFYSSSNIYLTKIVFSDLSEASSLSSYAFYSGRNGVEVHISSLYDWMRLSFSNAEANPLRIT
jgi:hypothetical protein